MGEELLNLARGIVDDKRTVLGANQLARGVDDVLQKGGGLGVRGHSHTQPAQQPELVETGFSGAVHVSFRGAGRSAG